MQQCSSGEGCLKPRIFSAVLEIQDDSVDLHKDAFGWRPPEGMTDKLGNVIEDWTYTGADMIC